MDTKKIALLGGLIVLGGFMFVQMKRLGTPPPTVEVAAAPAPVVQETPMTDILVANQTLPVGTRVGPEMLVWRQWPAEAVSDVFIDRAIAPDALESYLSAVVRSELAEGEPVTTRKVIDSSNRSVMSVLIRPGYRAVTIRITSDSAAAGFITPGDRVDIISTRRSTSPGSTGFAADTVFENVTVLSIDQSFQPGPDNGAVVLGSMATFELTQEDAEILTIADSEGELSLTLRPMSNERGRATRSHANTEKAEEEQIASMTVYRGGESQQVMLRGQ